MKQNPDNFSAALSGLLNATAKGGVAGQRRRWLLIAGAAVALLAGIVLFASGNSAPTGKYFSEEAALGNLVVTASASGTLQPTKSVDVGSELSGTLASVLADRKSVV